jgi:hypothetical protein
MEVVVEVAINKGIWMGDWEGQVVEVALVEYFLDMVENHMLTKDIVELMALMMMAVRLQLEVVEVEELEALDH